MVSSLRHVVVEGLPAVGKSEALALLARFYPSDVRVFPELVKTVVEQEQLDLFRDRDLLTAALRRAMPQRRRDLEEAIAAGFLCLEESHLGVHRAYAIALSDEAFLAAFGDLDAHAPRPDLFIRLDVPVAESIARQEARSTPQFAIPAETLRCMSAALDRWHVERGTPRLILDADRPAGDVIADLEKCLCLPYRSHSVATADSFDVLLLLGRPASGKSEFIDFMQRCPTEVRRASYHIGPFRVVDDFPVLWQTFQEDDSWERSGSGRRHSRRSGGNYAVADDALWGFLIERLNDLAEPHLGGPRTLIVEFSRGGPSGYADALARLTDGILSRAAALYLDVSFEESWRRNVARYDERRRGGILTHSVPREEMERTYGADDWEHLTRGDTSGTLNVRGFSIAFSTLSNEPESTDPAVLGPRYAAGLDSLFGTVAQKSGQDQAR